MASRQDYHALAAHLNSRPQVLEVTEQTYKEIEHILIAAGHEHRFRQGLNWPVDLSGLAIQPAFEAIEAGGCAPPVYVRKPPPGG